MSGTRSARRGPTPRRARRHAMAKRGDQAPVDEPSGDQVLVDEAICERFEQALDREIEGKQRQLAGLEAMRLGVRALRQGFPDLERRRADLQRQVGAVEDLLKKTTEVHEVRMNQVKTLRAEIDRLTREYKGLDETVKLARHEQ